MAIKSAGLLLYRDRAGCLEVLLVHPGGPFWALRDEGVWSIPNGDFDDDEAPLDAAIREVEEETGLRVTGEFAVLSTIRQPRKRGFGWAVEVDCDPGVLRSNTFSMQYPPRSGQLRRIPEVDRAAWFDVFAAKMRIHPAQVPYIEELCERRGSTSPES